MTSHPTSKTLPIDDLVSSRCRELGLTSTELVRRCGYANLPKGQRRLEELRRGSFDAAAGLIRALPGALDIAPDRIEQALNASRQQLRDAEEAAWRQSFKPHAIILTDRDRPHPLFVAAIIGVEALVWIDLDPMAQPTSYRGAAVDGVYAKLERWNRPFDQSKELSSYQIPAFGHPTGLVINYAVDRAELCDLQGRTVRMLPEAWRIGRANLMIGGRPIPAGFFGQVSRAP